MSQSFGVFDAKSTPLEIRQRYRVPAGTRLVVNVWKIHRNPRVWENTSAFAHKRFLESYSHIDTVVPWCVVCHASSSPNACSSAALTIYWTESPGLTIPKGTPLEVLLSSRLPGELLSLIKCLNKNKS
ncbi:hypothetical protein DVH24_012821 [Malus domestica]|uniref:Cytochrome P450 n=1 Tax=Malus domestica TaxID=3750 RepID=A0A498HUG1_MALDO|nr:hypothetical protein DVH24_012821 [Malus domestica]